MHGTLTVLTDDFCDSDEDEDEEHNLRLTSVPSHPLQPSRGALKKRQVTMTLDPLQHAKSLKNALMRFQAYLTKYDH